jgi:uncharacterized damage-inducible protein DinB
MLGDSVPGPFPFYKSRFEAEKSLTVRILKAIPTDALDYRPHPRSASAGEIAWTIVRGMHVRVDMVSRGSSDVVRTRHPVLEEILLRFEDATREHLEQLQALPAEQWSRKGELRVGNRIALDLPVGDIVWFFHFDEIHHRGQLSTYLRPMGARVPSIYGPSGDTNLP